MAADCKSARESVRWFESSPVHHPFIRKHPQMTVEIPESLAYKASHARICPLLLVCSRRLVWGTIWFALHSAPHLSGWKVWADRAGRAGSAQWLVRIQRDGKRQDVGLGSAKTATLAQARAKADELRNAVKVGKRDVLAERKDEAATTITFRVAARQYNAENEAGWKSAVYGRQWLASLENYAFPKLGDKATGSITTSDIITVLTPIWQEIPETARQVRNRICAVLDYAHAKGWRSREAPSGNDSLKAGRGLPRQVKARENRKAMPYVAVPSFITALRRKPSFGRLAPFRGIPPARSTAPGPAL
jgi:Arm DNA-binding domain